MTVDEDELVVTGADAVTLLIAAATNFVSYKDVSGDPGARVAAALTARPASPSMTLLEAHVASTGGSSGASRSSCRRGPTSDLPTAERIKAFDGTNDPALAGLVLQFGRYLLISSSRPGTQPANLQGIWNDKMNPPWDSKYTTNINTEMNYWPAEVGNLAECAEPLFRMIRELTDQGARRGPGALRRPRLGLPSEHGPLARGRAHGRAELGDVHDRRGLAGDASLGALSVHGRQGLPEGHIIPS